MKQILYERVVSNSGRVTYKEHVPPTIEEMGDYQVDDTQVIGIHTGLVVAMIAGIRGQLPKHMRMHRELQLLEDAAVRFASWTGGPMVKEYVEIGISAWTAAIKAVQDGLVVHHGIKQRLTKAGITQ